MDATSPPIPGFGLRCPACGSPRIMNVAEPCYQCGVVLPPTMPGKLGIAVLWEACRRSTRIILGTLYLLLFGTSLMLADFGWAALLMAVFGIPFVITMDQSRWRAQLGNSRLAFFLTLLESLALPMAGILVIFALGFTCMATCMISVWGHRTF